MGDTVYRQQGDGRLLSDTDRNKSERNHPKRRSQVRQRVEHDKVTVALKESNPQIRSMLRLRHPNPFQPHLYQQINPRNIHKSPILPTYPHRRRASWSMLTINGDSRNLTPERHCSAPKFSVSVSGPLPQPVRTRSAIKEPPTPRWHTQPYLTGLGNPPTYTHCFCVLGRGNELWPCAVSYPCLIG